jgi:hypothetical protein
MGLIDTCKLIQQLYEYNKNKMNDLMDTSHQNLEDIQNLEKKIVYEISKVNFSENLPAMLVFNKYTDNDIANFIKPEIDLFEEEIKKYDANYSNWKYIDEKDLRNYSVQNDLPVIPVPNKRAHDPLTPFLNNLKPIKTTKQKVSPLKTHRYFSFSNNNDYLPQQINSNLSQQIDDLFSSFGGQNQLTLP